MVPVKDFDSYIALQPENFREALEKIRTTIKNAAPGAEEVISYQMPAFKYKGILVYFAAFKNHIGFYPTSSGISAFETELSGYVKGKGSVQFPIDKPIPYTLISEIVKFRAAENLEKANLQIKAKKKR